MAKAIAHYPIPKHCNPLYLQSFVFIVELTWRTQLDGGKPAGWTWRAGWVPFSTFNIYVLKYILKHLRILMLRLCFVTSESLPCHGLHWTCCDERASQSVPQRTGCKPSLWNISSVFWYFCYQMSPVLTNLSSTTLKTSSSLLASFHFQIVVNALRVCLHTIMSQWF